MSKPGCPSTMSAPAGRRRRSPRQPSTRWLPASATNSSVARPRSSRAATATSSPPPGRHGSRRATRGRAGRARRRRPDPAPGCRRASRAPAGCPCRPPRTHRRSSRPRTASRTAAGHTPRRRRRGRVWPSTSDGVVPLARGHRVPDEDAVVPGVGHHQPAVGRRSRRWAGRTASGPSLVMSGWPTTTSASAWSASGSARLPDEQPVVAGVGGDDAPSR